MTGSDGFTTGPLVGGPFIEGDHTPLSVHKAFYETICPHPTVVDTKPIRDAIDDSKASAVTILHAWVEYLSSIDDPCVEIGRHSDRIFDY